MHTTLFLFKLKTCIVYCFEVTAIKINTFIVTIGKTIYNLRMFHVQLNVPIIVYSFELSITLYHLKNDNTLRYPKNVSF